MFSRAHLATDWKVSRNRIATQCCAEVCVSMPTARGVLFENWPITSNARERVHKWATTHRPLLERCLKPVATKNEADDVA